MELVIKRTYHTKGTNGDMYIDGVFICHCIELPWLDNQKQRSCIPEGSYVMQKRYSRRFGRHLWVQDVPGRSMILIHPANHALKELRGCIAPVTHLTGEGRGSYSRLAMELLMKLVDDVPKKEELSLVIQQDQKTRSNIQMKTSKSI